MYYFFEPDASPFIGKRHPSQVFDNHHFLPHYIGTYDGTTDPDDHIFVFTQTMSIFNNPEFMWCSLFSITLRGTARMWFKSLPPRSISSFAQLVKSFRIAFLYKVKFEKSSKDIMNMSPQGSFESLKEYVDRFNDEILKTDTRARLHGFEKLVINVFIKGLRPGPCLKDLTARPPSTLEDLLVRVNELSHI